MDLTLEYTLPSIRMFRVFRITDLSTSRVILINLESDKLLPPNSDSDIVILR